MITPHSEFSIKMEPTMKPVTSKPVSDLEKIQQSYSSGSQVYKPITPALSSKPAPSNSQKDYRSHCQTAK
jgi:hypothetical protein